MRFLRHLNWLIAAGLLCAGIAVIRWPYLTLDTTASAPTTAATLAGALFGAAALFAGAQINEAIRRGDVKTQLQDQQRRVRAVLDNEFIHACVNLMQEASDLLRVRQNTLYTLNLSEPLPTPIFENSGSEILCLPVKEIDALCTFYNGLETTRRAIRDESRALNSERVLEHMCLDLKNAEEVARKVWPTRKIEFRGEQACGLADKLKEQAAAIAKALET